MAVVTISCPDLLAELVNEEISILINAPHPASSVLPEMLLAVIAHSGWILQMCPHWLMCMELLYSGVIS